MVKKLQLNLSFQSLGKLRKLVKKSYQRLVPAFRQSRSESGGQLPSGEGMIPENVDQGSISSQTGSESNSDIFVCIIPFFSMALELTIFQVVANPPPIRFKRFFVDQIITHPSLFTWIRRCWIGDYCSYDSWLEYS